MYIKIIIYNEREREREQKRQVLSETKEMIFNHSLARKGQREQIATPSSILFIIMNEYENQHWLDNWLRLKVKQEQNSTTDNKPTNFDLMF